MRARLLAATLCLVPALALGGPCGDDVDGRRIPCACGDRLVGSRTLDASDPITQAPCAGRGLLVDVPRDRQAAVLDLGGYTVAGSGLGIGIEVLGGGQGGLTLRGPGAVRGFAIGVLAAADALARGERVLVADNRGDGLRVAGTEFVLVDCEAERNGGDGFALRGHGFHLDGNRAVENGRRGFAIAGRAGRIGDTFGNEAANNGREGLAIRGRDHRAARPVARGNGGTGIRAHGAGTRLDAPVAEANYRHGVRAAGGALAVTEPVVGANAGTDLDVRGAGSCAGPGCR
jgi:hypothetical protein